MFQTAILVAVLLGGGAQTSSPGVPVTGVVLDQTGAVLAGAAVVLLDGSGAVAGSATADAVGAFRFEGVRAGTYQLRATFEGFKQASSRVRVTTRAPGGEKIVLDLAYLVQEITVTNASSEVSAAASANVDAVTIDAAVLDSLPVFDRDYVAALSRFLDAGSLGNGGVTVVVNGMEVAGLNVSASAVSQIRVNQDPYSAEYSRPGRGRIEILTKPGSQKFSVEVNGLVRDSHFNARNALADSKPPERRRITEGFFGGPLGTSGKTSFMLSANDERYDNQAFIYAIGPAGVIQDTLPQASARALVTGSITRQVSDKNTVSIRPNYQYESDENRGVGGTTLASAATTFTHHEQQVTYTQQTVIRPNLVNQFQMLFGHEREPTTSRTADRGIVVAGAFTGGGGQGDLTRTETHINMNESLAWIKGTHLVQAGFQLPDCSRRGFEDRSGAVVIADILHSQPGGLTRYVLTNPGYPDPFASSAGAAAPPSIVQLAPDVQIPRTVQYSAGVDHQLQKSTTLSITYTG